MQFKDYYQILGVEPTAGETELKTAFRRLARKYHPDVSKEPDAEERFKDINEAYEALRDPDKRRAYDQLRSRGYRPGDEVNPGGFGGAGGPGGADGFGGFGGVDFEEIFAGRGGPGSGDDFSDLFEGLFGRRRGAGSGGFSGARTGQGPRPPSRVKMAVTLEQVYQGATTRVQLSEKVLDLRIPKGIGVGQSIRLKGQGQGQGDLLVEIDYAAHPKFEVDGRNVLFVQEIAPWDAALGCRLQVPTLGGTVSITVPPGSEAGKKLRLKGRGLPAPSSGKFADGDQIVELEVVAPQPVTEAQTAAYLALKAAFDKSDA